MKEHDMKEDRRDRRDLGALEKRRKSESEPPRPISPPLENDGLEPVRDTHC
jgi:hypothetical protein